MSKFKQTEKRSVPQPPSGSLSDIVFMLLFFFMVTTTMRQTESKVTVVTPEATEIAKLERKDLTTYVNVGTPIKSLQATEGNSTRININDVLISEHDIMKVGEHIIGERDKMSEADKQKMTVAIKADKDSKMGIITDVKQELRRVDALRIMYMTKKSAKAKQ